MIAGEIGVNDYLWKIYLKSGGKKLVDRFEDFFLNGFRDGYETMIRGLMKEYTVDSKVTEYCFQQLKIMCDCWENADGEPNEIQDLDEDVAEYMDALWDELMDANGSRNRMPFVVLLKISRR